MHLGIVLVSGLNLVPMPAASNNTFRVILVCILKSVMQFNSISI
jgi:hypothetical protein